MARKSSSKKKPTVAGLVFLVLAIAAGALIRYCTKEKPKPFPTAGQLQVHVVDVGQGDSLLIVTPERKTVLIDAGLSQAGDKVVSFLREHGIDKLDMVVATHPHADHIGGMKAVLNALPVKTFLDSGQPHSTRTYTQLLELIRDKNIKLVVARSGQKFSLDSGVVLTALGPREPFLKNVSGSDINANSVILRLTYGNFSMLFTGDSEDETEKRLIEDSADVRAQVLKIAHHGSRHASTQAFLQKVSPEAAIISCGEDNEYGHPSQPTLDRLKRMNVKLHRTDLEGDIQVTSDGNTYEIQGGHGARGDLWAGRTPRGRDDVGGDGDMPAGGKRSERGR